MSHCYYCDKELMHLAPASEAFDHNWLWDHLQECDSLSSDNRKTFNELLETEVREQDSK